MQRLGIDIDDVICKSRPYFVAKVREVTEGRVNFDLAIMDEWSIHESVDAFGNYMTDDEWDTVLAYFWNDIPLLPVVDGAVQAIQRLSTDFEIHYITGRCVEVYHDTRQWLNRNGFEGELHLIARELKHLDSPELACMIEDDPVAADNFNIMTGTPCVLYAHTFNREAISPRCEDWLQLVEFIETNI